MATNGDSAVFFTGNRDPRDNNILVGHTITSTQQEFPILFEFRTQHVDQETATTVGIITTVMRHNEEPVAQLCWTPPGDQLGMMRVFGRPHETPMTYFFMPATHHSGRLFLSAEDNRTYEWRRLQQSDEYDLFSAGDPPPVLLATFRREYIANTAVGRVHAVLKYRFSSEYLLLEAVIALCINRRMHGSWLIEQNEQDDG